MAKRIADTQLTKDGALSDGDGVSDGSQMGAPRRATAAQMAARKLAKPRGGRRPGTPGHSRPTPGLTRSQPSTLNASNVNGTQRQQNPFSFLSGSTSNTPNQSQSFPPFGGSTNSQYTAPSSSGFTFSAGTNESFVNPFAKHIPEERPELRGFDGEIFHVPPPKDGLYDTFVRHREGQEAPQFAAHSPFHHGNQESTSDQSETMGSNPHPQSAGAGLFPNLNTQPSQPSQAGSSLFPQLNTQTSQPPQTGSGLFPQANSQPSQPSQTGSSLFPQVNSQPGQSSSNMFGHLNSSQKAQQQPSQQEPQASTNLFGVAQPAQPTKSIWSTFIKPGSPSQPHEQPSVNSSGSSNASLFQQPQSTQATPNFFAHLGSPQPSANLKQVSTLGQGDPSVMSTSPDTSPSARPFGFLNASSSQQQSSPTKATASSTTGTSLFDRISKPTPESNVQAQPESSSSNVGTQGSGGSLFDRVSKPTPEANTVGSTNPANQTPAQEGSGGLFGRVSKPAPEANTVGSTNPANQTPAQGGSGGLFGRVSKPAPEANMVGSINPANQTSTQEGSGGLFGRVSKPAPEANMVSSAGPARQASAQQGGSNLFSQLTKPNGQSAQTPSVAANSFKIQQSPNTQGSPTTSSSDLQPAKKKLFGQTLPPQVPKPSFNAPSPTQSPVNSSSQPHLHNEAAQATSSRKRKPDEPPYSDSGAAQATTSKKMRFDEPPSPPKDFTEPERKQLKTGWRLKVLDECMRRRLRSKPDRWTLKNLKLFYEPRVDSIYRADGGPIETVEEMVLGKKRKFDAQLSEESAKKQRTELSPDPATKVTAISKSPSNSQTSSLFKNIVENKTEQSTKNTSNSGNVSQSPADSQSSNGAPMSSIFQLKAQNTPSMPPPSRNVEIKTGQGTTTASSSNNLFQSAANSQSSSGAPTSSIFQLKAQKTPSMPPPSNSVEKKTEQDTTSASSSNNLFRSAANFQSSNGAPSSSIFQFKDQNTSSIPSPSNAMYGSSSHAISSGAMQPPSSKPSTFNILGQSNQAQNIGTASKTDIPAPNPFGQQGRAFQPPKVGANASPQVGSSNLFPTTPTTTMDIDKSSNVSPQKGSSNLFSINPTTTMDIDKSSNVSPQKGNSNLFSTIPTTTMDIDKPSNALPQKGNSKLFSTIPTTTMDIDKPSNALPQMGSSQLFSTVPTTTIGNESSFKASSQIGSPNLFSTIPTTTKGNESSSKASSQVGSSALFSNVSMTGNKTSNASEGAPAVKAPVVGSGVSFTPASSSSSPNTTPSDIAGPSDSLKAPAFKVPTFGAGTTPNFIAQFQKASDKTAEEVKNKRKAEEYDSEEEDEATWERKYEEELRMKKQKLEQASKAGGSRFVDGKMQWVAANTDTTPNDTRSKKKSPEPARSTSDQGNQPAPNSQHIVEHQATSNSNASNDNAPKKKSTESAPSVFDGPLKPGSHYDNIFKHLLPSDSAVDDEDDDDEEEEEQEEEEEEGGIPRPGPNDIWRWDPVKKEGYFSAPTPDDEKLIDESEVYVVEDDEAEDDAEEDDETEDDAEEDGETEDVRLLTQAMAQKSREQMEREAEEDFYESIKTYAVINDGVDSDEDEEAEESPEEVPVTKIWRFNDNPDKCWSDPGLPKIPEFDAAKAAKGLREYHAELEAARLKAAAEGTDRPSGPAPNAWDLSSRDLSSKDDKVKPTRKIAEPDQTKPSGSAAEDHTWKTDSPIKFGTSSSAPAVDSIATSSSKSALGGLFGAPRSGASNETSAKPLFGSSFATPSAKPSNNTLGFNFTPSKPATTFLAPPSNIASGGTSRAASPGATTGESANESNADNDDGDAAKDAQVDLVSAGPGEENEDTIFKVRAKAFVYDKDQKKWDCTGVGLLRVLKHRETGATRILLRVEPSGRVLINTNLLKDLKYENPHEKIIVMPVVEEGGKITTTKLIVGKMEDAEKLTNILLENRPS
ncbi:hypothetical protein ACLMJK_008465 [Lecanora helva]